LVEGVTSLIELKSKKTFEIGLGTTALQRHFLKQWCLDGGKAYLLARVGKSIFFLWGADVGGTLTAQEWIDRSLVYGPSTRSFDFEAMHRELAFASNLRPPRGRFQF
jgi:hypothetical protein